MNKNTVLNILLGLVFIGIVAVVVFKLVIPPSSPQGSGYLRISGWQDIGVMDINGNKIKLGRIIPGDSSIYVMICDMDDCFSCIYKGVDDMKKLGNAGHEGVVVVVADKIEDVKGWSAANFPGYSNFYMLDTASFYDHIQTPSTPVIAKIESGKVSSFRLILP